MLYHIVVDIISYQIVLYCITLHYSIEHSPFLSEPAWRAAQVQRHPLQLRHGERVPLHLGGDSKDNYGLNACMCITSIMTIMIIIIFIIIMTISLSVCCV